MAKGQKRSNREIRKPKKKKDVVAAPAGALKGLTTPAPAKKKA